MNLDKYTTTHLEDFVNLLYFNKGVTKPEQLTISHLSSVLDVTVNFGVISFAYEKRGQKIIYINEKLSDDEKRIDFFHELCHIYRHEGNQLNMHKMMKEWQEWDCFNFSLYASMPIFMVRSMSLPAAQEDIALFFSNFFHVSYELAALRVIQIFRRINQLA
ncbi:protein of unknown function [Paenibacillus sp. UNCCL117]|uniref:ImmA/IrrE family metallo-endopeptidase n=1 Tax=unclassified Paenibacillus TaxID=185978 RepID=UPI00088E9B50|nr:MULTISPECIES: ImmA/IrrE family metallo-endopeptidase [unclassified Paenibacillus]SDC68910.1 protein of unknown function [Paenibacillus sp. cl123]SFW23758.1 protein of unknown function [Paenibacillus sp. UNCCL117]